MSNRILKESICVSEQIDRLSPFEEVCFYRMIVNADDYGRLDGRINVLRARMFPLREMPADQLEQAIESLVRAGLVARYRVDGMPYLLLPGWNRNQKVRTKRMKCPPPPGWREPDTDLQKPVEALQKPVEALQQPVADMKQPVAGVQQPVADLQQPVADLQQPVADVKQPVAGVQQSVADVQQPVADVKQPVADCVLNPIQSESESQSEFGSVSSKKEKGIIYNNSWRFSPRARSATANILAEQFRRDRLPCSEIRDLFVVIERALEMGNTPEEISRSAHMLRAPAFAARYMAEGG